MRDPFAGYDAWLERPYQEMCEAADAFVDWCEANDIDPDDPNAEALFEAAAMDVDYDDYYDYDDYEEADYQEDAW